MPAAWAAAIGAIASIYSAQQQKKAAKKLGSQQDRLYGIQADTAEKLQPYALNFYNEARSAYGPAASYYKAVAGGDRSRVLSALSPQLAGIGQRYNSILQASRALNPRGGGSASYNADLVYRAGDEQQALVNTERSNAYGNLAKMAGLAGDLGAGAGGLATNAAAGASGMLSGAMNRLGNTDPSQAYGELGKALADLWGKYSAKSAGGKG